MGTGRLVNGRFDLSVSFRHAADLDRREEWRRSFEHASRLLFEATGGVHQLGEIRVFNAFAGDDDADAWLFEEKNQSKAAPGLGVAGAHMTLYGDERFRPFVILRLFAPYAYGVWDEWFGPGGAPAGCLDDGTSDACIMEGPWDEGDRFGDHGTGGALVSGRYRRFCTAGNHDPDHDTLQEARHHESCWATMVAAFPELDQPPAAPSFTGIDWVLVSPGQRFVLVVDRSGSMGDEDKLAQARFGAQWWIDAARTEDELGVVSFADEATVDLPLATIGTTSIKQEAHDRVKAISAGGSTAIGDGLRTGLERITASGTAASTQSIVLVTDGIQNAGEDPLTVLPDIVRARVRVYTIAVGISVDTSLLLHIANATGGKLSRIDPTQTGAVQAMEIRNEFARISGLARDHCGVASMQLAPLMEGEQSVQRTIDIEEGSEVATFVVNWPDPDVSLQLVLQSPDGETIDQAVPGRIEQIAGDFPYAAFVVQQPAAGTWTADVKSAGVVDTDARLVALSEHPRIGGFVTVAPGRYEPGDAVPVFLQAYFDAPVTKLRARGVVTRPDGTRSQLRFGDEPLAGDGVTGDGVYRALFEETYEASGTYTVDVLVESTDETVPAVGGEPLLPGEDFAGTPVPIFRRRLTTTVVVGEEPIEGGPD
ncbi:MAG TPA: VWA domain-containing protein [Solirubrobacteraceae bacterium]|jgi:uncharacterized protein YegL